jgi:hypothetical protein
MTRWPEMMKRKTAAEYCDMSEAAFEREVISGRLPSGVVFGGREHWRKAALDRALDRLTGDDQMPEYRRKLREKYGKAA